MATYVRQSSFSDGDTITAALFNNEFNQLVNAFNASSGHTHDGSIAGDGGPISNLFSNALVFGTNANTDVAITFNATTNDGVLTWMEDEDYFKFSDDLLIDSTEKVQFRDTGLYIYSSADGQLDIVADTEIQIAATTIDINGNVNVSGTLTIGGAGISEAELEILDGATVTTAELNILDGKAFLDEDNLASDSATGIASQQSIKAYVDGITTTNITSTGALNSGSITSGFGNINNGSSTITTTGAITGGSFVIGSADINENDLESIDGITAGTVAASKAVVVNANKDITGFRNLTATGTISGTLSGAIASTTTATTQAESDDSTKVATTAYVVDKITTLIGGAPSTLNDLNELAAAINDDANYNSTLTTALATKLPLAGGTMTGDVLYNDLSLIHI